MISDSQNQNAIQGSSSNEQPKPKKSNLEILVNLSKILANIASAVFNLWRIFFDK